MIRSLDIQYICYLMTKKMTTRCIRFQQLQGLGRVRCSQPYPSKQKSCFHSLNPWPPSYIEEKPYHCANAESMQVKSYITGEVPDISELEINMVDLHGMIKKCNGLIRKHGSLKKIRSFVFHVWLTHSVMVPAHTHKDRHIYIYSLSIGNEETSLHSHIQIYYTRPYSQIQPFNFIFPI